MKMKYYKLVFCIILSLFFNTLNAEYKVDTTFLKANQLYQEGKYELAAELYLSYEERGLQSSELYFNAGNAFFRSNKLGKARLFYEKALLLDPRDEEIKQNLAFVESMLTDRFEEVPVFFLRSWLNQLFNLLHPNSWAILSLVSFSVFFTGLMIFIFSKSVRFRKIGFYTGVSLLALSIIFYGISLRNARIMEDPGTAIIMEGSQVIRSAPRQSGKELFILHEGTKIWLENEVEEWIEIRLSDGRKGWLPHSAIERI